MLLLGYGLSVLVKPLYIFANSTTLVLTARLADRVGKGIRGAPRDALVADVTEPANRGRAYGLRQTLDTIGAIIGPVLALLIMWLSANNYQLAFAVALIPAVAVVFLLYFGIKEPEKKQKISQDKIFSLGSAAKVTAQLGSEFFILMAIVFVFGMANSSDAFLILKAKQVGISDALCPLTLVVMNLSYAFSAYPAGVLSDKLGHGKLLTSAFAIYALTYLGFAVVAEPISFMSCCLVYGLYLGLSQGVLSALVAQIVPAHLRGTAFGLINLATGLSLLPASYLTGYLFEHYGAFVAFAVCAAFALAATILLACRLSQLKSQAVS
jgi:MFS family permease